MRYAGIIENDVVNGGEGVAVSLFMQGCPHHCEGCFNPETWDFDGGKEIDEEVLINKVIKAINKNGILRNLSILGGEPLCGLNIRFINKLIATTKQKYPSIKVWVWTGYLYEDIEKSLSDGIDVLIDGRFEIDKKDITLPYRGSSNQRVIDVKKTVDNDKIILWSNK